MIALCVDDEPLMLGLLREAVEASEDIEEVHTFINERDALAWAETHPIDVAFLDIEMHGMSGMEVARRLRENAPYLPVIFCTGYSDYALEAMRLHADGYLLKPIHAGDVQKELDRILGKMNVKPMIIVSENGAVLRDKNGKTIVFHRSRTKDLARILLEAKGEPLSVEELRERLFGNMRGFYYKDRNYLFQLLNDLRTTLAQYGAEEALTRTAQGYAFRMKWIISADSAQDGT